jgi:hypothetical protein
MQQGAGFWGHVTLKVATSDLCLLGRWALVAGEAHFAINSPEGVVGWNTAPGRPALKVGAGVDVV